MFTSRNLSFYAKLVFIFLILCFASELPRIIFYCLRATKAFVAANYDYNLIRQEDPVFAVIQELKQQLPENAKVEVSPLIWKRDRVKARYAIYPIQIESKSRESWNYFIDLEGTFKQPKLSLTNHQLSTGVKVFLKSGNELISQRSSAAASSNLKAVKGFLLITIGAWLPVICFLLTPVPPSTGCCGRSLPGFCRKFPMRMPDYRSKK